MDEMTALRAMAERLAARGAGFGPILGAMGAADQPPPELLPGAVPDDWPATIPLPPGATIVGAVHWGASGPDRPAMTHLFVAAPRPAPEVRAFYLERLAGAGWTPTEGARRGDGFVYRGPIISFEADMTAPEDGTSLALEVRPARDGGAHVQMTAVMWPPGTPGPRVRLGLHGPPDLYTGLPAILLPPDALFGGGRGRGGHGSMAEVEVTIRTDTDHAGLAALVAGQLEAAGWARRDGGLDGALAWSTWSYAQDGEPYAGMLYVLRCPERPGRYRLSLVGEWAAKTGARQ